MSTTQRFVSITLGTPRFSGAVPHRAAVAYDPLQERWVVTRDEDAAGNPSVGPLSSRFDDAPIAPPSEERQPVAASRACLPPSRLRRLALAGGLLLAALLGALVGHAISTAPHGVSRATPAAAVHSPATGRTAAPPAPLALFAPSGSTRAAPSDARPGQLPGEVEVALPSHARAVTFFSRPASEVRSAVTRVTADMRPGGAGHLGQLDDPGRAASALHDPGRSALARSGIETPCPGDAPKSVACWRLGLQEQA